jgi:hypothetical protein
MHTVKARLHRFALIAYWRVRLALICHLINEIDHEIRSQMHIEHSARRQQLIEAERRQEGVIKQRQAMDALDALTLGPREPAPEPATPRRRHHEQPQA